MNKSNDRALRKELAAAIDKFTFSDHMSEPPFERHSNGERKRKEQSAELHDRLLFAGAVEALIE